MPRPRRHNPLQSLSDAYHAFRAEAEGYAHDDELRRATLLGVMRFSPSSYAHDDELRRATLEDAARVLRAMDEIENGFNRNQMTSVQLERIAADVLGELSFREF